LIDEVNYVGIIELLSRRDILCLKFLTKKVIIFILLGCNFSIQYYCSKDVIMVAMLYLFVTLFIHHNKINNGRLKSMVFGVRKKISIQWEQ